VLILPASNQKLGDRLHETVKSAYAASDAELYPISTGLVDAGSDFGSEKVRNLRMPRVVLATGEGTNSNAGGEIWHHFDQQLNYPISLVNQSDLSRLNWSELDVLILPDGNYSFLSTKDQAEACKKWIQSGGRLIALESAVSQLSDWGIKLRKVEDKTAPNDSVQVSNYEGREREAVSGITPGSIWPVQLDNTHPLAFGYGKNYFTLKGDTKVYDFTAKGWNVGVMKKDAQVAGFTGSKALENMKDGVIFGELPMGRGSAIFFVDDIMFRNFWQNGKLMMANAVFFIGQGRGYRF
jgi:hypothetical protein